MEPGFEDSLGWCNDEEISKIIGNEKIYYSNKVQKYNSYSIKQERSLLLTNKCIYNIVNKKVKRQMKYEEMRGISFSSLSNEFIFHANQGYDIHFLSPDKILIIYIIAKLYEELLKKPIILCEIKEKSLKAYVTSKTDKKKDSEYSRLDENYKIDTRTFLIDNEPNENNKRSGTDLSCGKANRKTSMIVENPKEINSETIFSNDSKIKGASLDEFNIIKIIGRGLSGKVVLTKNIINNEYYALKSIKKDIIDFEEQSHSTFIKLFQNVIKKLKFPFIFDVHFCFQTNDRIYFASSYIQGEEFFYNIKTNPNFNEEKVKFYSGIISLTLDYLHTNGIEYNFFNSKNILIDKDGYLKLVPFHMGKIFKIKNSNETKRMLNKFKNEYSSPEIFSENDSIDTKSADWWNLGIIIFEMIYKIPPFYSDDDNRIKEMITKKELKFPESPKISESLKDLIKKLLKKDYRERLGYQNGFEDIKKHEFFKGFNFKDLLEKKIKAPHKPIIGNILDDNKKYEKIYTFEDLKRCEILTSN